MSDQPHSEQELLALATLGRAAEELMSEPLIARWFADTQSAMIAMMREEPPEQAAHWHRMMDCIDKLQGTLEHYIRTGALATKELQDKQHSLIQLSRFKFKRGA